MNNKISKATKEQLATFIRRQVKEGIANASTKVLAEETLGAYDHNAKDVNKAELIDVATEIAKVNSNKVESTKVFAENSTKVLKKKGTTKEITPDTSAEEGALAVLNAGKNKVENSVKADKKPKIKTGKNVTKKKEVTVGAEKKEDTKGSNKLSKVRDLANSKTFPETIEVDDYGTLKKTVGITPDTLAHMLDEGKTVFVASFWSKRLLKQFNYDPLGITHSDNTYPKEFKYDLDISQVIYATTNKFAFYMASIYTDVLSSVIQPDFERVDSLLVSSGIELEFYVPVEDGE